MGRATLTRTSSGYSSLTQTFTPEAAKMSPESPDLLTPSNKRITPFLIYLLFFATLGPLQFGYHLVSVLLHPGND